MTFRKINRLSSDGISTKAIHSGTVGAYRIDKRIISGHISKVCALRALGPFVTP